MRIYLAIAAVLTVMGCCGNGDNFWSGDEGDLFWQESPWPGKEEVVQIRHTENMSGQIIYDTRDGGSYEAAQDTDPEDPVSVLWSWRYFDTYTIENRAILHFDLSELDGKRDPTSVLLAMDRLFAEGYPPGEPDTCKFQFKVRVVALDWEDPETTFGSNLAESDEFEFEVANDGNGNYVVAPGETTAGWTVDLTSILSDILASDTVTLLVLWTTQDLYPVSNFSAYIEHTGTEYSPLANGRLCFGGFPRSVELESGRGEEVSLASTAQATVSCPGARATILSLASNRGAASSLESGDSSSHALASGRASAAPLVSGRDDQSLASGVEASRSQESGRAASVSAESARADPSSPGGDRDETAELGSDLPEEETET